MRLTVIGSSPAWPNPGSAHSGYLVESEGQAALVDCGPGVLSRLRAMDAVEQVGAIVISHLHLDHWGDLVPWVWMTAHDGGGHSPLPLWLPPGSLGELHVFADRFGSPGMFERAFAPHEFEPRAPFSTAGLTFDPVAVEHYGFPAFGFRIGGARGSSLAYTGDTGPCQGLAELADGVSLLLCEATLERASDDPPLRGHLSAEEALELGHPATVLTHRPSHLETPDGARRAVDGLSVSF